MNTLTSSHLRRPAPPSVPETGLAESPTPLPATSATERFPEAAPFGALAEATPTSAELGFYVHVPFCRKRCYYCSFNTAPLEDRASVERYVRSAVTEIELLRAAPLNGRRPEIATVFLGGGTPSLLEPDEVADILDAIRDGFAVAADVEITVECNPESVMHDKLVAYRAAGVNRVSLGVQSLDDSILPVLGRLHDARGARAAFGAAREAGFGNVSVDLMYGLPGLDVAGWRRGLAGVLDWQPDHLSAYGLTLESGSLWGATGRLPGRQALGERLILGLRRADGVPATDLVLRTADDATLARRVETWRERGLLRVDDGRARLSEEGFLLSDALFVELL